MRCAVRFESRSHAARPRENRGVDRRRPIARRYPSRQGTVGPSRPFGVPYHLVDAPIKRIAGGIGERLLAALLELANLGDGAGARP